MTKMYSNRRFASRMKMSAKILKKLKSAFKYCTRPAQYEKPKHSPNATDEQKLWNQDQSMYPSYEEIIVTDSRESIQQSLSTVDSGVHLSKDHTTPFTLTVEAVVEAKPFYPDCCSTPNSLSSEYTAELDKKKENRSDDQVNYSTYTKNKSATLERAIQNVNTVLNVDAPIRQCDEAYENYQDRKTKDEIDEKFVVNLFESRPSKRWQRRYLSPKLFEKEVIELDRGHISRCSRRNQQSRYSTYSQLSKSDEMYLQLKKNRDAECVKMNQASNALLAIKMKGNREWKEELVAEKILLECDIRNKLIIKKIRDLKCSEEYSQIHKKRAPHKGSITISNFEFDLKLQDKPKNNKYTDFYVMALSQGTTLNMSKIATVNEDNKLVFNDSFTLNEIKDNFTVNVEVFTLRLRTKKDNLSICRSLFKKKTNCCMSKIYYEDVNLNELLQSEILTPSFTPCVNFTLTKNQIGNSALFISPPTESKFKNYVNVKVNVNRLDLGTDVSGFLTWGTKRGSVITWERKWCSLKGSRLSIYNYPQDEEFDRDPCQRINLEYCLLPLVKEVKNCPRKRTFVIKTGRPSTFRDHEEIALRKRQNFVLEKFYVSADNNEDFKKWTGSLESTLDTMRDWKQLVFIDDYYVQ